jgi:hypothetical protein
MYARLTVGSSSCLCSCVVYRSVYADLMYDRNILWEGKGTIISCIVTGNILYAKKKKSVSLVRKRTTPTERPPLVGEVSANFCG